EEELLQQHYTITGWAEALQRRNIEVIVVSRFRRESSFQKNKVQYYFISDQLEATFSGWRLPVKFLRKISALDADLIHLHNFTLSLQTFLLKLLLNKKTAIIIQHHGGKPPGKKKRIFHNLVNSIADGFFLPRQTRARTGL
ncbi:MAG: glycosyltransferase family 1 protein, partial [Chitinophagaceae bacterium]|nr:glycosyltransferase family 1 protein [Chitinophagaceae bacterium]